MKLARIGDPGAERPAVLHDDGTWRDLSGVVADIDGTLLGGGPAALDAVREALAGDLPVLQGSAGTSRFGPPVAGIGKVVCIGLNYRDHAAETGAQPPAEPIVFMKAADTVVGPDDDGPRPAPLDQDRLGGRARRRHRARPPATSSAAEDAAAHIAGYAIEQRRLRAGVPDRARRPVGQGQELRDVQPARPVARDRRRGRRPAGAAACASGSTVRLQAGRHDRRT